MGSANVRWCYNVTTSSIGWTHTLTDPCKGTYKYFDISQHWDFVERWNSPHARFVCPSHSASLLVINFSLSGCAEFIKMGEIGGYQPISEKVSAYFCLTIFRSWLVDFAKNIWFAHNLQTTNNKKNKKHLWCLAIILKSLCSINGKLCM